MEKIMGDHLSWPVRSVKVGRYSPFIPVRKRT